jgi:hypothetical protein
MEAVGRLRRRAAAVAGSWRRWQQDVDEELLDVAGDIEYAWPAIVAWAVATAVIMVGLCRLLLSYTVGARPAIAVPAIALVCVAAAVCVFGIAWVDWRNRRHNEREGVRFILGAGMSLVAIGVCIEAFAGVTTVLWRSDLIAGPADIGPSLWRSEEYYLWHLVNWLPLVDIVKGVRWREPTVFGDSTSGALLLCFQALLVAPLLRIGVGAYRWVTARLLEAESKWLRGQELRRLAAEDRSPSREELAGDERTRMPWLAVVLLAASPVVASAVMPLIFEPGHGLDTWWTQRIEGTAASFLRTAPQWISVVARTAPQWISVVALVAIIGSVAGLLWERYLWVRDRHALAQAVVSYAALVGFAVVTAAALNLALLHVGVAAARPALPAGGHVRAAIEAQLWHLADAPGRDLPNALHWSLPHDFVDRWSAGLFLVTRLFLVGVLAVPVAQAVMSFAHFHMRRPAAPAGLDAVTRFGRRLHDARAAVDRAGEASAWDSVQSAATYAVGLATDELDSVRQLFGAGEIAARADAAVAALLHRLDAMEKLEKARFFHQDVAAAEQEFGRLRDNEQLRYDQYRDAVRSALTRSAGAV